MVQRSQHLGFMFEASQAIRMRRQGGRQNFDCYFTVKLGVSRSVDLAYATATNRRENFIGAKFVASTKGHRRPPIIAAEANFATASLSGRQWTGNRQTGE